LRGDLAQLISTGRDQHVGQGEVTAHYNQQPHAQSMHEGGPVKARLASLPPRLCPAVERRLRSARPYSLLAGSSFWSPSHCKAGTVVVQTLCRTTDGSTKVVGRSPCRASASNTSMVPAATCSQPGPPVPARGLAPPLEQPGSAGRGGCRTEPPPCPSWLPAARDASTRRRGSETGGQGRAVGPCR